MAFTLREFSIESYRDVFQLWQQCDGVGLGDTDSEGNIRLFLRRNPGTSFIAEKDNEVIGAILGGHDGRRGYIHHLAVLPGYRRRGIGRMLVDECLKGLSGIGIDKCHILVFRTNEGGRKFWESVGWTFRNEIGVLSKFIE